MGATHITMLPTRFCAISRLMRLEVTFILNNQHIFECHIVRSVKSLIDVHKYTLGVKQENISATKLGIFVKINVRDSKKILCQTSVHTSHPGTG